MRSFRVQIVLWIGVIVAFAIVGVSMAMSALNINRMSANIDTELLQRAKQMMGPMGQGGPPNGNRGEPGGPPPLQQRPPRTGDEEIDLIGAIRRPRWISPSGRAQRVLPNEEPFDPQGYQSALRGARVFTELEFHGMPIRVYSVPVFAEGRVQNVFQIARELRDFNEIRRIQRETLIVFLPLGLIAAGVVAWFLAGRVMRPIADMGKTAEAIGSGELATRLQVQGDDEFAKLGHQFNHMADSVQTSIEQLRETLDQQRRFTADASHELRTPLTRMLIATSGALHGEAGELQSAVQVSDTAAREMSKLVNQLLELAKLESGDATRKMERLDLRTVVSDAVTKASVGWQGIEVHLPETAVFVEGEESLLERAFTNLLENAKRYSTTNSRINVSLTASESAAVLCVEDEGEGIAPEHLAHLAERFYRVDTARSREAGGSGLGLSIVDEIVTAHGGTLRFESEVGKGTKVFVTFNRS